MIVKQICSNENKSRFQYGAKPKGVKMFKWKRKLGLKQYIDFNAPPKNVIWIQAPSCQVCSTASYIWLLIRDLRKEICEFSMQPHIKNSKIEHVDQICSAKIAIFVTN